MLLLLSRVCCSSGDSGTLATELLFLDVEVPNDHDKQIVSVLQQRLGERAIY